MLINSASRVLQIGCDVCPLDGVNLSKSGAACCLKSHYDNSLHLLMIDSWGLFVLWFVKRYLIQYICRGENDNSPHTQMHAASSFTEPWSLLISSGPLECRPNMFWQPVCDIITFQKHLISAQSLAEVGSGKAYSHPFTRLLVSGVTDIWDLDWWKQLKKGWNQFSIKLFRWMFESYFMHISPFIHC